MRSFIILLNVLLISLILYSFLGKTNTIIENLQGCPTDRRNIIYRNQANINRLFSRLNTALTSCGKDLKPRIRRNTQLVAMNTMLIKRGVNRVAAKAQETSDDLDKIEWEETD